MSRTTRLFVLMQTLRRYRRPVSGACLAEELGISQRTLYRDIAELKALGADIEGEPGIGYVLKPGFLLPPLMFSEDEIEAIALGLSWVTRRTDDDLAASAGEALSKVAAVLPTELRYRLEDSALLVGPVARPAQVVALSILHRAVREERKLGIAYLDAHGQPTSRTIWPIAITFFESVCMIVAWCELREAFRHFRTDRITEAEVLEQRYPGRRQDMLKAWKKAQSIRQCSSVQY
ncbi:transcriptional regulator [Halomonas cupida]|uniref:Transcriptional regulator n=1 Tax=Halomonas cupida TaxID=44933 RepID=A0A1M7GJB9_9GAMM|nr:YafY family protein [Halomonas cupida]GEN23828.1 transcriptional regulator [Halomonas cupida]SHM16301.1 Predicted DNA-binding transcriptional regulator YafY, contains an HTH and WYL domains [Halomonas cupida]